MPKKLHTRRRVYSHTRFGGKAFKRDPTTAGKWVPLATGYRDFSGKQETVSEGHHWPPPKVKGGFSDQGGSFYTSKSYVVPFGQKVSTYAKFGSTEEKYSGDLFPYILNGPAFPVVVSSSDDALDELGATAISRCQPTNSVSDASTFLGELAKDGIPSLPGASLWESRVKAAVKAGDEFLNFAFGWSPLVRDVLKLSNAAKHADTVLAQYERDSGKMVRRRYYFPSTRETSETTVATNKSALLAMGNYGGNPGAPLGNVVRKVETVRKQWFSGAFTYYLPSDYDSRKGLAEKAALADKLLGTSITPETLWQLAPWSWAVDWFSNAGDVISNMSAFSANGLVMRYGYMMEHIIVTHTYTQSASGHLNLKGVTVPPLILVTEVKKRRPANPYGFGVSWDGLSTFQAAVLAALGITRRG